jgi:maleate isomerase
MTDVFGWRMKFGVLCPSTNTVLQPQLDALRPPGVTNHISRMDISNNPIRNADDFVAMMREVNVALEKAVDVVMTCEPGHLILGVAGESLWGGGLNKVKEIQQRVAARVAHADSTIGITMSSHAVAQALKVLNVKKNVAVISPYHPSTNDNVRALFEDMGYKLIRSKHFCVPKPTLIAQTPEEDLRAAVREVDGDDVDAIVQMGANLPFWRVAIEAERWLNKPVLSINAVSYWHALRTNGINDKVYGQGRLLAEF